MGRGINVLWGQNNISDFKNSNIKNYPEKNRSLINTNLSESHLSASSYQRMNFEL